MPETFWSNTIWFVLLAVVTIIQLIIIFFNTSKKRHAAALYLCTAGAIFSIEAIIFCFLRVYDYYPKIFPHSPIDDGLAGNLFSQFSLAATALMIAVFHLKYYWIIFFSVVYCFIEQLFLALGIYEHNFYSTWLTFVGLIILFTVTKKIYINDTIYEANSFLKYLFSFFAIYTLHMPTALWGQIITGIMKPNLSIFANDMRSYAFVSLLNLLFLFVACRKVYYSSMRALWKLLYTLFIYVILFLAWKCGLFIIKENAYFYFFIFATINIFGMYAAIFIIDKLMKKKGGTFFA